MIEVVALVQQLNVGEADEKQGGSNFGRSARQQHQPPGNHPNKKEPRSSGTGAWEPFKSIKRKGPDGVQDLGVHPAIPHKTRRTEQHENREQPSQRQQRRY